MHHIHHSDEEGDQRTNLGVVFPWWDRMFGTYRESMFHGDAYRGVGLKDFPDRGLLNVAYLLTLPFRRLEPHTSEKLSNGLVPVAGESEATL
jgi:sterol desaturase/sphingolipid hydroxylase (fatty acid hydroxylase superfamily)